MNILVTGANGQLGNEMRIISKESTDKYIFTDVNQIEGLETTYLDITDQTLGIDWKIPLSEALLSEKDKKHPLLADFDSPFIYNK